MIGVRLDGIDHILWIPSIFQDSRPDTWMIFGIGVLFVVKIMKKSGNSPFFLIFAQLASIGPHGRFDRQGVPDQAFALGIFVE